MEKHGAALHSAIMFGKTCLDMITIPASLLLYLRVVNQVMFSNSHLKIRQKPGIYYGAIHQIVEKKALPII